MPDLRSVSVADDFHRSAVRPKFVRHEDLWLPAPEQQFLIEAATTFSAVNPRVWEIPSGERRSELSFAGRGGIRNFSIDPGGDWIAVQTGFDDEGSLIVVMPIWPDLVTEEACRRARRILSPTEVEDYSLDPDYSGTCEGLEQISD